MSAPMDDPGLAPGELSILLREIVRAPPRAADSSPGFRAGQVVGRFELVREIGRGGFGVVYEARDRELGRAVAFKAVRRGAHLDVGEDRLLREAEAAARLCHPNIATLFDAGHQEGVPYLVMELLHGHSLAERIARGALPVEEALRIGVEVAKGVAHAHGQGVVHRDLTPGNIFLCDDGQVKVLDFGMAHALGRRKVDGGTSAYMAPEQRRGAPEDERTDVFALGTVLFQMLSGELPFDPRRGEAVAGSRPSALDVPGEPALGTLVARMLDPDPVERPRDAIEVLGALMALRDELARSPGSATSPVRTRRRSVARLRARRVVLPLLAAALLAPIAVAAWRALERRSAPTPPAGASPAESANATAIAVLPFVDMSPQKDQEYFGDGIAEEILNALAHVEGLRVIGRTSSFAYKGKSVTMGDIARDLKVGALLEGSVRKEGPRVRITAKLLKAEEDGCFHLDWSESYDRELTGIFALQDEIARSTVQALKVKLTPPSATSPRSTDPEAYRHYLLGKQFAYRGSDEGDRLAAEQFERSLELDPAYAPGWAWLSTVLQHQTDDQRVPAARNEELRRRALAAAARSVELDPSLPDAYAARAYVRYENAWDWAGAQRDLERALALGPSSATTRRRYGVVLAEALGRVPDGVRELEKAAELDPLWSGNWTLLGIGYLWSGRYDEARIALNRAIESSPEVDVHWAFGTIALARGEPTAALAEYMRSSDPHERLQGMAMAEHDLGEEVAARAALDQLEAEHGRARPLDVARVYGWWGDRERAFEWLDRAYAQRAPGLVGIQVSPLFRKLHGDPRWTALLMKMNLPEN
jgi:serine/threonine protein kinase